MEHLVKACWLVLGALHIPPAVVLVAPGLMAKLYGGVPGGDLTVMIQHRAALFLCVVVVSIAATILPEVRRLAAVILTISMVSFLLLYAAHGWQPGPLRTIAIADAIGLVPLLIAAYAAFTSHSWSGP